MDTGDTAIGTICCLLLVAMTFVGIWIFHDR